MSNNIKVVCRFRPQNALEIREGGQPIVSFDDNGQSVKVESKEYPGTFTFDRIFPWTAKQNDVFEYSISPIVDDVINGYNGTVFAYGQTGSGKTFTMMGPSIDDEETKGIIPRIVDKIFASILASPSTMEYTVKVSYMEIYMEKIRDLLNPVNDNLPIHEEKNRGVYVKGLFEVYVSSIAEIHEVMRRGGNSRMVAYTNMNAESSRSHSIFVVTISQKNLLDGSVKSGKLYLVDLAGSEKVGKTGASGQTLEEAKKINKSLSALGMVINALTDGKSTHIPYRDSKLTRILQESLGGNSRTTLIINCSPSSYNDAETVGTLRFGTRAKSIKNKAKVNQELSAAELKLLLKKAKTEAMTFTQYIAALEGEVTIWRQGGTVPKTDWASMEKIQVGGGATPLSSLPGHMTQLDTSRPSTPAVALELDEREEFLKRENELTDQIAEKEAELLARQQLVDSMREELTFLKEQDSPNAVHELNDLKLQLEKVLYESKEGAITVDSLREANQELSKELEELKKTLMEIRLAQKDSNEDNKEKKKMEKMAQMMANLDPSGELSAKEAQMRETLSKFESPAGLTPEEASALRKEIAQARSLIEQHEQTIADLNNENVSLTLNRDALEMRLQTAELEYEELLDKTIADEEANSSIDVLETISELRVKLEAQYSAKRDQAQQEIEALKQEIARRNEDIQRLSSNVTDLRRGNEELKEQLERQSNHTSSGLWEGKDMTERERDMERIRKTMAQQLADFDVMKKALMRDLQNRCEKVVELEISLDETREQYNNVLRNSNNKAQQQKMAFLERNLEQLTLVQKKLVEQNSALKKEVAISERKLAARNERIANLEGLLQDAQENLTSQNHKFETQLRALRERLEQARSQKSAAVNFGRIAKPLRGGVAAVDNG
ncbi:kinesin heavy chain [Lobosporangium transversale]|uniref:Kinesin-like protein n=1 Tax=Lobosporangium transversale TaxID=64571 RepID=A0A1Y2G7Y5_9FUNG|nr:kinesin heavy chain [Lobosporangium transversale]ORZ02025.1 kinesin heavy chain [Lobosporangium transversale]|eukprot:XP_021876253.1 kinesin heavy chain [Lobosporangium transversale]